jgi:hypothetical protein
VKTKPSIWVSIIFGVLAVIYVIAFALFVSHLGEMTSTLTQANPGASPGRVDDLVNQALIIGGGYHLACALVFGWLTVMTRRGWDGARIAAPIVLALDVAGAVYSEAPVLLPQERPYIIAVQVIAAVLQVAAIALLWRPLGGRPSGAASQRGRQEAG